MAANVQNIKQLSGNTLTRIKAWLKMLHQEEETALLGEKQTHTRKQSMTYNELWMFITSYTIMFDLIGLPEKFRQSL